MRRKVDIATVSLQSHRSTAKDLHATVDEFYLVLTDAPRTPVYSIPSRSLQRYQTGFHRSMAAIKELNLVGYLEEVI